MVGKGIEIGCMFDELVVIIDGVMLNDKFFVILDICYINDVGYNVKDDFDGVLVEFDKIIGLDCLKVIYVNDFKNFMGLYKDCYVNIGFGIIGFEVLNGVVYYEKLVVLLKILEIFYVGEDKKNKKVFYGFEIVMLKN